jgi:exodeoxyribonuclease VII small subunit
MATKKKMSLEEATQRLEDIVNKMENEKLPLEESLKLYEEAVGIVARCSEELEDAKRRIMILTQGKDGEIKLADFTDSSNN